MIFYIPESSPLNIPAAWMRSRGIPSSGSTSTQVESARVMIETKDGSSSCDSASPPISTNFGGHSGALRSV